MQIAPWANIKGRNNPIHLNYSSSSKMISARAPSPNKLTQIPNEDDKMKFISVPGFREYNSAVAAQFYMSAYLFKKTSTKSYSYIVLQMEFSRAFHPGKRRATPIPVLPPRIPTPMPLNNNNNSRWDLWLLTKWINFRVIDYLSWSYPICIGRKKGYVGNRESDCNLLHLPV